MKLKKNLVLWLTLVLAIPIFCISVFAESDYTKNEEVLTIDSSVSEGAISIKNSEIAEIAENKTWEYYTEADGIYICRYLGSEDNVIVPEQIDGLPVVQIGMYSDFTNGKVFKNYPVKTVQLPDTVKKIYASAFKNCSSLTEVNIPEGVREIDTGAFSGCTSLKSITIPSTVSLYEGSIFENCTSLTDVVINSGIDIASNMFEGCSSLKSVTMNKSVSIIDPDAFRDCKALKNITLNEGLTTIGAYAFMNSGLTEITTPSTLKNIEGAAFLECNSLTQVKLNEGLMKIDIEAFRGCKLLNTVNLPDSLSTLGEGSFRDCKAIEEITVGPEISVIGENAFSDCEKLSKVKLSEGLREIGYGVFNATALESIIIPSSVTSIGNNAFSNGKIKYAVFLGKQPDIFGSDSFNDWEYEYKTILFYTDSTGWTEGTYNGYKCYPYPEVNEEIKIDDCDRQGFIINISGTDVAYTKGTVSVWSDKGGKDDVEEFVVNIAYDPEKHISYVPSINLDTAKHNNETGLYTVEFCYGTESGKTDIVKSVEVDVPTVSNKIEIELPDVSVTTGGTIRVPVQITNNIGFSTFTFILNYDSSILTAVSAEKGGLWEGSMVMNPKFAPNQVSLNGMDIANNLKTGDLCYVDFKVNDNVQENIKTEISVEVRELYQFDDKYKSVPIRSLVKNSSVDIQHIVSGDVDFDGNVTALDATQALLHSASVNTLEGTALEAADYNGDGVVTAYDATLILLRAANLDQ